MLDSLIAALSSVPPVIWSGIIGSGMTLLGVWLMNRGNSERLRIQIRADAVAKEKERQFQAKKEVYLVAIEGVIIAQSKVMKLGSCSRDQVQKHIDEITESIGKIAKTLIVADDHTAKLIASALTYIEVASVQILRVKISVDDLERLRDEKREEFKEGTAMVGEWLKVLEDATETNEQRQSLQQQIRNKADENKAVLDAIKEIDHQLIDARQASLINTSRAVAPLAQITHNALLRLRRDLGVPFKDEKGFTETVRKLMSQSAEEAGRFTDDLYKKMKEEEELERTAGEVDKGPA